MEVIQVAEKILQKIGLLEEGRKLLKDAVDKKDTASAMYERELAKTILRLKNSEEPIEWEGETILKLPITLILPVAKGMVWQLKLDMDLQESDYKITLKKIDCIQAELNGLQSINKHLSEV